MLVGPEISENSKTRTQDVGLSGTLFINFIKHVLLATATIINQI